MPIRSKPSSAAKVALAYITLGSLIEVWSAVWYIFLRHDAASHSQETFYVCYGFLLTGLVLFVIGLAIGRIGRAARHAELPPVEGTPEVSQSEKLAAGRAPIVNPVNPAAPLVAANGSVQQTVAPAAPLVGPPMAAVSPQAPRAPVTR
jgi:hypothetical protein